MSETITKKKRIRVVAKRDRPMLSVKQANFISHYTNPKSETFNNAYRSALKAGFNAGYANQILSRPMNWLRELQLQIGDERRLRKAESNLEEVQNLAIVQKDGVIDTNIIAQRNKVDMFLAERLDKVKYSTRTENATIVKVEHTIDEETKKRLDALL